MLSQARDLASGHGYTVLKASKNGIERKALRDSCGIAPRRVWPLQQQPGLAPAVELYRLRSDLSLMAFPCFPCPCPLSPGCPQSLSRSFKNSSTPSNSFTSAKLIACAAILSTRPVF